MTTPLALEQVDARRPRTNARMLFPKGKRSLISVNERTWETLPTPEHAQAARYSDRRCARRPEYDKPHGKRIYEEVISNTESDLVYPNPSWYTES